MPLSAPFYALRIALLAGTAILLLTPALRASTTLENMRAACNEERNAHARYLAFAQQAEKEGYGQAASLFRAAARAEQVHAANHAEVILKPGAEPKAAIKTAQVKSTCENLQTAINGESYKRDSMYPEFIKQAKADGQDINGPKGGTDKRCRVLAEFAFATVLVLETQPSWEGAVVSGMHRVARTAARRLQRIQPSPLLLRRRATARSLRRPAEREHSGGPAWRFSSAMQGQSSLAFWAYDLGLRRA